MFESAKLKVEWANSHINQLDSTIRTYIQGKPYELRVDRDFSTGQDRLNCVVKTAAPKTISLIIGDIAHNLRSALDILANDVVERDSGTRGSSEARFPIYFDATGFNGGAKKLKGASADSLAIFERIQPYNTGKKTLRMLHELNIGDKHKLITPVAGFMTVNGIQAKQRNGTGKITVGKAKPIDIFVAGTHWLGLQIASAMNFEFQGYGQITTKIMFDETDAWHIPNVTAVETMMRMSQAVTETIDLFR